MLIIMGTSLKVHGIKKLVRDFASVVHTSPASRKEKPDENKSTRSSSQPSSIEKAPSANLLTARNPRLVIFVNRTPPPADLAGIVDYWVEGDTDSWCTSCEADWRKARPQDWEVQPTLFDSFQEASRKDVAVLGEESNTFKVVKGKTAVTSNKKGKGKGTDDSMRPD
jgi:NAD+-dependent protein deacetylase SIR2